MENEKNYPNCPYTSRDIVMRGLSKSELLEKLQENDIQMNAYAKEIFTSDLFMPSQGTCQLTTIELTVRDLGFYEGATMAQITDSANRLGLHACPIELGPYMRLQYTDQSEGFEGKPITQHQAPYGSVTIVSEPLSDEEDFPKGFYLRCIEGVFWLRGYRSGADHVWQSDDRLIFLLS